MWNGQPIEIWLGVAVNLSAFGLMAWLVRHTFTKTIPRLATDFREMLEGQRVTFREELRDTRDVFRDELKEERLCHCTKLDQVVLAVNDLKSTVQVNCRD